MTRRRVASASPYEARIGFSRAVRTGNRVSISGRVPIGPDGKTVGPGNPSAQAREADAVGDPDSA